MKERGPQHKKALFAIRYLQPHGEDDDGGDNDNDISNDSDISNDNDSGDDEIPPRIFFSEIEPNSACFCCSTKASSKLTL